MWSSDVPGSSDAEDKDIHARTDKDVHAHAPDDA